MAHVLSALACTQIWATMNNCAGVSRDIILSKEAFEVLVRASLRQLRSPGLECLSMVTREMLQLAEESEPPAVRRCEDAAA
jgi:Dynamin central region